MSEGRPPRQEGAVQGRFGSMDIERGEVVRAVAIAAIFALVFFLIPHVVGIYWVKILTAAAIYFQYDILAYAWISNLFN